MKLCRVDAGATVIGCGAPGGLCPDAPARLEAFTTFGTFLAAPRGRLPRQDRTVAYEACTERCDRFLEMDEHLRRWPEIAACVVEVTR